MIVSGQFQGVAKLLDMSDWFQEGFERGHLKCTDWTVETTPTSTVQSRQKSWHRTVPMTQWLKSSKKLITFKQLWFSMNITTSWHTSQQNRWQAGGNKTVVQSCRPQGVDHHQFCRAKRCSFQSGPSLTPSHQSPQLLAQNYISELIDSHHKRWRWLVMNRGEWCISHLVMTSNTRHLISHIILVVNMISTIDKPPV